MELISPCVQHLLSKKPLPTAAEIGSCLRSVHQYLKVGVYEVSGFRPGFYLLDPVEIIKAREDPNAYDLVAVDSGTIVLADFAHVSLISQSLTWEAYDEALSADFFGDIEAAVGGPFFAVLDGSIGLGEFEGDGLYRIRPGALLRRSGEDLTTASSG